MQLVLSLVRRQLSPSQLQGSHFSQESSFARVPELPLHKLHKKKKIAHPHVLQRCLEVFIVARGRHEVPGLPVRPCSCKSLLVYWGEQWPPITSGMTGVRSPAKIQRAPCKGREFCRKKSVLLCGKPQLTQRDLG